MDKAHLYFLEMLASILEELKRSEAVASEVLDLEESFFGGTQCTRN
jgi:hypothetical protein